MFSRKKSLRIAKCPDSKLAPLNRMFVSDKSGFKDNEVIKVATGSSSSYHSVHLNPKLKPDEIGLTLTERQWLNVPLDLEVSVSQEPRSSIKFAIQIILSVEFLQKSKAVKTSMDTEEMAKQFLSTHTDMPVNIGQRMTYQGSNVPFLVFTVQKISTTEGPMDMSKVNDGAKVGFIFANTEFRFEPAKGSEVLLKGACAGSAKSASVINPNWNFEEMGIGGLSKEFSDIFRRAFASRLFPPAIVEDMGLKHAKGILLYGPPGTGKTLMARQISKMLNTRPPKFVQGPEILSKMVGESEANVRALFVEAEKEERAMGPNSGLHMIIMDELDAICKQRGSVNSGTGVHDTVVNQLLSKIDGVEQLNNILIIGMTNRKDMIDDALLRPGRLEIHMEISLPNEKGRVEILNIHTATMRKSGRLAADVNIEELAALTKNFSGAEIEGLVRAAQSTSLNSFVTAKKKVEISPDVYKQLSVNRAHFMHALEHDCHAAFGAEIENLNDYLLYDCIVWGPGVSKILQEGSLYAKQTANSDRTSLVTVLLEGERFTGKTALAVKIALEADFPFTKIITPGKLVEMASDAAKIRAVYKVFADAYRSELSCVILDNIESLIEYVPIGPRFNTPVLQTITTLLKELPPRGKKLLVIATTSKGTTLHDLGLHQQFTQTMEVPVITKPKELLDVIENVGVFTLPELEQIRTAISECRLHVGIKKLIDVCMTAKQVSDSELKINTFLQILTSSGGILQSGL